MSPTVSLLLSLFLLSPSEEPVFQEVGAEWGIDFRHHHGGSGRYYMVETMVGGLIAFDYDFDGDPDLLFLDGAPLPGYEGEKPQSRLFRNDGPGHFVDTAGYQGLPLGNNFYGCGGTAGDVDNDGDLDLFLTAFGDDRLLVNRGDGTFEDRTSSINLDNAPRWTAGSAFADVDRDGDLDLFVAGYVDFSLDNHRFCGDTDAGIQSYCHPGIYEPEPDRLYRNRGDGTFEDLTVAAGLAKARGAGLGAIFGDLDLDGLPDLYVANDETPNFLYRNRGDGTFEDLSLLSGTAYSDRGRPEAGMGVALGDFDGNGTYEIAVTNFELETNALYTNLGSGLFSDARWTSGLAEPSLVQLGFGIGWGDVDHDGDLDLAVANGHILDNAQKFRDGSRFRQPNQLFENLGNGKLRENKSSGLQIERSSRGLALADLDGDGDLDLVIASSNEEAEIYENRAGVARGPWLQIDLEGTQSNRRGVGARLELTVTGQSQVREVHTASSYLSQNPLTTHFGLGGSASRVDSLTVYWPSSRKLTLRNLPANRRIRLYEIQSPTEKSATRVIVE